MLIRPLQRLQVPMVCQGRADWQVAQVPSTATHLLQCCHLAMRQGCPHKGVSAAAGQAILVPQLLEVPQRQRRSYCGSWGCCVLCCCAADCQARHARPTVMRASTAGSLSNIICRISAFSWSMMRSCHCVDWATCVHKAAHTDL